jgi:hypothetical protein
MAPEQSPDHESNEPTAFERRSRPLLIVLTRAPRWLLLVVILGLTVIGLLLENAIGGVVLLVLACFAAWLAILGWARLSPTGRLLRLLVIGLIVFAAFTRLV